ncbi:MAG: hypothetical protein RR854_00265 [Muribaculaceae bacterium]
MAVKCLGNCLTCEALKNGEVDEVVCPLRVQMIRIERIEAKMTKVLSLLENSSVKPVKPYQSIEVELEESTLNEEENETKL